MNRILVRLIRGAAVGAVLMLPWTAQAGGPGTTAAQFLKIGVGARAMGMGGAYAAVTDDAHSLYWNPAGVARMERAQLVSSYNLLYQDTSQGFMSYVHPTRFGVLGGGLDYLQVADIEKRAGDTAAPLSTFAAKDSALFLSYALPEVWSNLSLGINAKYISLKLDSKSASAYAIDLGAHYQVGDSPLNFGLSVLNLGSGVKLGSATDPLPMGAKLGSTYSLFKGQLLLAAGVDYWPQEKLTYGQMGVEWKPIPLLALRTGPQLGGDRSDLGSLVGMGAGLGFQMRKFGVDYAYVPFGDLGSTHRLSLKYTF